MPSLPDDDVTIDNLRRALNRAMTLNARLQADVNDLSARHEAVLTALYDMLKRLQSEVDSYESKPK